MKTTYIHDIIPCKALPASSSKLNLDDYSFLSDTMKKKIYDGLEEIKIEEGDSPAGLYEEYHIMVKKKLDAIQESINKIPNYTLDEFAMRNAYGQLYLYVDTDLKTVPVTNATYITREVPNQYDPEISGSIKDSIKKRKTLTYVSLILIFILTFAFFVTVGKDFAAFDDSVKKVIVAIFGVIVFAAFLMQHSLSKFMNALI